MPLEHKDNLLDYEAPKRIAILLKIIGWLFSVAALVYGAKESLEEQSWITFFLYSIAGIIGTLLIYIAPIIIELLISIRDNTSK